MATKLVSDRTITVRALLIPDETPQPLTEAGVTLSAIARHSRVGPVRGDSRPIARALHRIASAHFPQLCASRFPELLSNRGPHKLMQRTPCDKESV